MDVLNGWLERINEAGDERTKGWFLVDSPLPPLFILLAYYLFVRVIGPRWMKNREPFELRKVILTYNALQVIFCITFLYQASDMPLKEKWTCCEILTDDPVRNKRMPIFGWYYYMIKYLDLLDTVFFVLKKKQSHITFLHLFHHISMVIASWLLLKFIASGILAVAPLLNMWVHSFMYAYYFAALYYGKVDIFWKKWMTKIQLVQFVVGNGLFIVNMCNPNCTFPKLLLVPIIIHGFTFTYLFSKFYYRAYIKPKTKES